MTEREGEEEIRVRNVSGKYIAMCIDGSDERYGRSCYLLGLESIVDRLPADLLQPRRRWQWVLTGSAATGQ